MKTTSLKIVSSIPLVLLLNCAIGFAATTKNKDEGHEKESAEKHHEHDEKSEGHSADEKHDDHGESEEHGEERELPAGITSYDEHEGFSLSPEALKNFEIRTGSTPIQKLEIGLPTSAIVKSLRDTSVFIKVGNKFRPFSVDVTNYTKDTTLVRLKSLPSGALVVLTGVNFLKTIQLSLEEDPSEGHGH